MVSSRLYTFKFKYIHENSIMRRKSIKFGNNAEKKRIFRDIYYGKWKISLPYYNEGKIKGYKVSRREFLFDSGICFSRVSLKKIYPKRKV